MTNHNRYNDHGHCCPWPERQSGMPLNVAWQGWIFWDTSGRVGKVHKSYSRGEWGISRSQPPPRGGLVWMHLGSFTQEQTRVKTSWQVVPTLRAPNYTETFSQPKPCKDFVTTIRACCGVDCLTKGTKATFVTTRDHCVKKCKSITNWHSNNVCHTVATQSTSATLAVERNTSLAWRVTLPYGRTLCLSRWEPLAIAGCVLSVEASFLINRIVMCQRMWTICSQSINSLIGVGCSCMVGRRIVCEGRGDRNEFGPRVWWRRSKIRMAWRRTFNGNCASSLMTSQDSSNLMMPEIRKTFVKSLQGEQIKEDWRIASVVMCVHGHHYLPRRLHPPQ